MKTRSALAVLTFVFAACGDDGPTVAPDASGGVRVSGCDDPQLWEAPALYEAELRPQIGGGPCSPAQYPLHRVFLAWSTNHAIEPAGGEHLARACWRVTDATSGSGWTAGQSFSTPPDTASMTVMGFERPVTVEGRVLRDDGTIVFSVAPHAVALDQAHVLDPAAGPAFAVMSPEAWAERDAVHVWGQRIATDEVLDATAIPVGVYSIPVTLNRTSGGVVRRIWSRANNQVQSSDVLLGRGTRGRVARWGRAMVVDTELDILGGDANQNTIVRHRIALATDPLEVVGNFYYVTLQLPGTLVSFDYPTATAKPLAVGDGVLLPSAGDQRPMFFDGHTFHVLEPSATALSFDDATSFTPRAEDVALLGKPRAVYHGIVFGENGLLLAEDAATDVAGPRFASYTELFGEGRLGPVAADTTAYVFADADGNAALYQAPYVEFCE